MTPRHRYHLRALRTATSACAIVAVAALGSTRAAAQPTADINFGTELGAGDFDCDGVDDLAAGLPKGTDVDVERAGYVEIRYGADYATSAYQRIASNNEYFTQDFRSRGGRSLRECRRRRNGGGDQHHRVTQRAGLEG
jgi:hypothetical protein